MESVKYAAQLTRDNSAFLVLGAPVMCRELLYAVKPAGELPSQSGRVAVMTGGSRGIGLEAVRKLLQLDMHLVIGSSSADKARASLEPLLKAAGGKGKLDVWPLDLSKQSSVLTFCRRFIDSDLPLHLLLCNAGIMFYPNHELTEDGFEMQMAVNHLGHFSMQHLLLPRLAASGTVERRSRIVSVSSAAHAAAASIDFDDLMQSKMYSPKGAYFQSKGAQIMCAKYLAKKLSDDQLPVTSTSLHPGVIYTDLYDYTTLYKMISPLLKRIWKSAEDGAETLLYAAVSPECETENGVHFENAAVYQSAAYTLRQDHQTKLWLICCELCKIAQFGKPSV